MKIQGLHHITLVSSNAQRTVDFYVKVLGLRLIKQTVNFDDPSAYHLYFGDAIGSPGSAIMITIIIEQDDTSTFLTLLSYQHRFEIACQGQTLTSASQCFLILVKHHR